VDKKPHLLYKTPVNLIGETTMAVIVKYVVERNGEEKMTFTSKTEADAYEAVKDEESDAA
jgi:hypothetical protein